MFSTLVVVGAEMCAAGEFSEYHMGPEEEHKLMANTARLRT